MDRKTGRSHLVRIVAITEGKPDDMVTDVFGPGGDQFAKSPPVVGKQGAGSFFEAFEIASHRRHEMIGRVPRGTMTIAIAASTARLFDKFSQSDRRSTGLASQPIPVPRQQRYFAGHDPESWSAPAARLRCRRFSRHRFWIGSRRRQTGEDFFVRSAQVDIERLSAGVVEDKDRLGAGWLRCFFDRDRDLGQPAGRQPAVANEGGEAFLKDLPSAEMHRLDAGHFAVEDNLGYISDQMHAFYQKAVAPLVKAVRSGA